MNSRERVVATIRREPHDRMPIYGWVSANLTPQITSAFGSVEAFEDHYGYDYAHLFGGPPTVHPDLLAKAVTDAGGAIEPDAVLDLPFTDPDDPADYEDIRQSIQHHKLERERFVYVQTPGIFEALNGIFGIENHLLYLAMCPDGLARVYRKQAEWNRRFAMNCIDLGVDMVHVSDDWGAQHGLLFNREMWWNLIYPNHKCTVDAVKARGTFASIHSDGNINAVIDGIIELGYDVVHPWQESAGMSLDEFQRRWLGNFTVMGGLDIQTTLGFGDYVSLESSIRRVVETFYGGGLLFCTTHFVQDHCSLEELSFAYDLVVKLTRDTEN